MSIFLTSLIFAFLISLLSIIGIIFVFFQSRTLKKSLFLFISFSAGTLLGGAFFHLLPKALEEYGSLDSIFIFVVIGFVVFFTLEKILRWHHCHDQECKDHKHIGKLSLIGDFLHNIIDGIIIISAFSVDFKFGLSVILVIAIHEIIQEIGDFGILIYSGYTKTRALIYNFISASSILIGVVLGYFLINNVNDLNNFLLPFAAGGFIYIASSDLIPQLHRESNFKKSLISFIVFILALLIMYII